MAPSAEFWKGKRVFLTGHTGFKGSWLSAWLLKLGAQVRGYALAPAGDGLPEGRTSFFDEMELSAQIDHIVGDVRDPAKLEAAMLAFAPEVVIHMAAQPLVRYSYAHPVETYGTNVMGTVHLLETCRKIAALRSVVVVSSDKCYENREQIWGYRETDPMGGHDPYSNSKGCSELVTSAYRSSFLSVERMSEHGVTVASARAGNVIGGGDWSVDRLVPDAMRALLGNTVLEIRNPEAVRPWQHVLDPLSGYLTLAERAYEAPALCARGWNFGPAEDLTLRVAEVLDMFARRIGPAFRCYRAMGADNLHEATLLTLDCRAARHHLGWRPRFNAEEMVAMTADWYACPDPEGRKSLVHESFSKFVADPCPV